MIGSATRIVSYVGIRGLVIASVQGAKAWAARWLGKRFIRRRVYDYLMWLDTADRGISRTLLLFGRRELEHKYLLEQITREGSIVFDIGANIGYYAIMESKLVGNAGTIVAIEPSPANVELLKRNLALNSVANVKVIMGGVSDKEGDRNLFLSAQSNLNTFHPPESGAYELTEERTISVKTTTVPQLMRQYGRPDLIRMDVEGHEVEILNGMIEGVEKGFLSPTVIFEVHRNRYSAEHDMEAVLRRYFAAGYHVPFVGSSQESGTRYVNDLGYQPLTCFKTDFMERAVFSNLAPEHVIDLVCHNGGVRTVVLAPAANSA